MKSTASIAAVGILATVAVKAAPAPAPWVDTMYPYTGPETPVGDWVDNTLNGNGKGFPRLHERPAVMPDTQDPTNNINVISLAYLPDGMNIHFQTPFGIGCDPEVRWGTSAADLCNVAKGSTTTYGRTPSCSEMPVILCSEFFHDVQITGLDHGKTYYYQIDGGNGTTASPVKSFTTTRKAGDDAEFSIAIFADMGYTNAQGTWNQIINTIDDGAVFTWHGGDISYADDWYSGILPCESDWPVCYNGTASELPGIITAEYDLPLPTGEFPNQGGPYGGDMSVLYETNWDLWQQWMTAVTTRIPHMVLPGNHEAACAEFDGPGNTLTAYLNNNQTNSTAAATELTYYSCPPSQRNFTTYQHRFRMPGEETGGVSNFWYSFDYGLAHFISFNGETDYYKSPEYPFFFDLSGNETHPAESETYVTDSGPFGAVSNWTDNTAYEQYQWLKKDLESVDRSKTPWVFAMSHRPMYSSETSSYQTYMRNAFEDLFIENGVDMYFSGHIHWYERMLPMGRNGTINYDAVVNNHTYVAEEGKSIVHIINGMAGNIESHSVLDGAPQLNMTAALDTTNYGFNKLTVQNATHVKLEFIKGVDGFVGDYLTVVKSS